MLLITGDEDDVVLPDNVTKMAQVLRTAGKPVSTRTYAGGDHSTPLVAIAFTGRGPTVADIVGFISKVSAAKEAAD